MHVRHIRRSLVPADVPSDANSWPRNVFAVCPVGAQWPYAIILAIPPLCRFIQCIKRWLDSGLAIHLINVSCLSFAQVQLTLGKAGKYLSVIVQYSLFVGWRSRGQSSKLSSAGADSSFRQRISRSSLHRVDHLCCHRRSIHLVLGLLSFCSHLQKLTPFEGSYRRLESLPPEFALVASRPGLSQHICESLDVI